MQAAAVILAAGSSTRFGSPKQLAITDGITMLDRVIGLAREAGLAPIIAVVPPDLGMPADVIAVPNDAPDEGMSRSLRLGFSALPAEVGAALVLLGDQPTMAVESIRRVLAAARAGSLVVAASAAGRLAPPILVLRAAFELVDEAEGDAGLAPVLARHRDLVTTVEVNRHPPDVDVPADLAALGEPDGSIVADPSEPVPFDRDR
jgi:nicotine blue oxidoreductase